MDKKFTKGKWHSVEYAGNYILQLGDKYGDENILDAENVNQEAKYNALLISKAPEMLEILERIIQFNIEDAPGLKSEIEQLIKEATEL